MRYSDKKIKIIFSIFCYCTIYVCIFSSCNNSTTVSEVQSEFYEPIIMTYAYEQLSPKEQALYTRMADALFNHELSIEDDLSDYTFEQINKVSRFIFLDYPQIFWATESGTIHFIEQNDVRSITGYDFKYILTQSQKNNTQSKINDAVQKFLNGLGNELNEYERILAAYEYILENTDYDTAVRDKIAAGTSGDETAASQTIASVFIDKKTVCAGYSKAMQYLLNQLGIFCVYISGSARGEGNNHAWNLVKIEGDYYLFDVTWGNPITEPVRERRILYDYFGLTDADLSKTHIPNDELALPVCTATRYNYFVYNNLMLDEYDIIHIENIIRDAAAEKKTSVSMRFSNETLTENAKDNLFGDNQDIFNILGNISSNNPILDDTGVYYSFNSDINVLNIELNYN